MSHTFPHLLVVDLALRCLLGLPDTEEACPVAFNFLFFRVNSGGPSS